MHTGVVRRGGDGCYDSDFPCGFPLFPMAKTKSSPVSAPRQVPAASARFANTLDDLYDLAEDVVKIARKRGATASEADVSEGFGQSVSVRKGSVETIEYNRDKGIGVTVYVGQRKGYASTSDFSRRALKDTVEAALAIARYTAEDECAGLPEPGWLARTWEDLDLYHPWQISVDEAIALAQRSEAAAFAVSPSIRNSEGASVSMQEGQFAMANSAGFVGGYPTSRHYLAVSVIAEDKSGMQRDDWYSSHRNPANFPTPESIGDYAARRALSRLGARKVKTGSFPVIFEAPLAATLLGNFVHAASGGSLYRKSSFLEGALGSAVFSPAIHLAERPHLPGALASSPFDSDGLPTHDREVVSGGVLNGYFLSVYTARKLGMAPTGNAGGSHNLILSHQDGAPSLDELLRKMGRGLLVTELLGQGVNYVTGDYSRGAAGFWVEDGVIQYPVEEITIAGNLREMFKGILAVGGDVLVRGSKHTGSILLDRMTVAGS